MVRRVVAVVARVGQGAAFLLGLAVLGGLVLGPASFGLAAVGDPLTLGKANNAGKELTALIADLADPVLRLSNQGGGPALELKVAAGKPPLKVGSDARVANLDADKLDGQDATGFVRPGTKTYTLANGAATGPGPANPTASNTRSCDDGDRVLTGGVTGVSDNGEIVASAGFVNAFSEGWTVTVKRIGNANATIDFRVVCLDFAPFHEESRGAAERADEPARDDRVD